MALTNPLAVDNLEASEAFANVISTGGNLLGFFGPLAGGGSLILTGISVLLGIAAIVVAQDIHQRVDAERFERNKPTPGPTTTIAAVVAVAAPTGKQKRFFKEKKML